MKHEIVLIPKPNKMKIINGEFSLKKDFELLCYRDEFHEILNDLYKKSKSRSNRKIIIGTEKDIHNLGINLKGKIPESAQGYFLCVEQDNIVLSSKTTNGLFYGIQTLRQLINGNKVYGCIMEDYPALEMRAVMYDTRGQVGKIEYLKSVIDRLASYKINYFFIHIENTVPFRKYPFISEKYTYTWEEIDDLINYAEKKYIEVVPMMVTLGHMTDILKFKQFKSLRELPYNPSLICPTNKNSIRLIEDLLVEMIPHFKSKYFHVNGDEPWQVIGRCKNCVKKDKGELYLRHYIKINNILKKYGKIMMMWDDELLHYDIISKLPRDIIIFDWNYSSHREYPTIMKASQYSHRVVVCPAIYDNFFPDYERHIKNVKWYIQAAKENNVFGEMTCLWEHGNKFLEDYWYGIAASAETSWNEKMLNDDDFSKRFFRENYPDNSKNIERVYKYLINAHLLQYSSIESCGILDKYRKNVTSLYGYIDKAKRIKDFSEKVLRILKKSKNTNVKNLIFAAKRYNYFSKRIIIADNIYRKKLDEVKKELVELKKENKELYEVQKGTWLETRKKFGLKKFIDPLKNENKEIEYIIKNLKKLRSKNCPVFKKEKINILKSRNFNNLGQSPIRGQSQLLIILFKDDINMDNIENEKETCNFIWKDTEKRENITKVYVYYNNDELQVAFVCYDKNIKRINRYIKSPIHSHYYDDEVIILLDPFFTREEEFYICMNSLGVVYTHKFIKNMRLDEPFKLNCKAQTTLEKDRWKAKIRIPFSNFNIKNPTGRLCGIDFGREYPYSGWISSLRTPDSLGIGKFLKLSHI